MEKTALHLGQAIRDALVFLQPEVIRQQIMLRTILADDLPGCWVTVNRIQLQQVVLNLAIDGIKAMREVSGMGAGNSWPDPNDTKSAAP